MFLAVLCFVLAYVLSYYQPIFFYIRHFIFRAKFWPVYGYFKHKPKRTGSKDEPNFYKKD